MFLNYFNVNVRVDFWISREFSRAVSENKKFFFGRKENKKLYIVES